ncbi:MAG TPA: hypothetical protein VKY85_01020 [Candidatus Angelobacter sp.]|nr:hypothetical protein [Candidatus Angelobacter sp.]
MIDRLSKKQAFILSFILAVVLAPAARAGVGDIISLLTTITSTIRNGIGVALSGIQTIQNTERQLQQQVLWPLTVINQTKASVSQVRAQFTSLAQQVHSLATNSATLANPKQLELLLRGERARNLGQVGGAFTNVYQSLPPASDASPSTRNVMDVDDAMATGSLKSAVISDQASEQLLGVADSVEQQTAASAPGSAPLLTTQALAANLQSQAFLQRMLAAQLRQEAAKLAHTNMLIKESSAATKDLNKSVQQILSQQ